jgi:taurine dioxygenase
LLRYAVAHGFTRFGVMGRPWPAVLDFRPARIRLASVGEASTMVKNGFEVRPMSGSVGAEILGIDLAVEPGHNVIAAIRQTWLEHGVIFFRDQDLTPAKFLGEVVEFPFIKGIEGFPEIIPVVKLEHETKNFGGIWHTDTAYLETPPMGTMLIACEVPPRDGAKTEAKQDYISEHPVVRIHPETGRKALYVNIGHTVRCKDMTDEESAPILNFLFQH